MLLNNTKLLIGWILVIDVTNCQSLDGWLNNHKSLVSVEKKKSFSLQIALKLLIVVEY